eukprot:GEMP01081891.1.p1 GENE.GEMP01081891.1~~GEMP01081891.1.p1  ORF type:complete len:106 (-),score=4.76 GEMP01081891.1:232-549(-)
MYPNCAHKCVNQYTQNMFFVYYENQKSRSVTDVHKTLKKTTTKKSKKNRNAEIKNAAFSLFPFSHLRITPIFPTIFCIFPHGKKKTRSRMTTKEKTIEQRRNKNL